LRAGLRARGLDGSTLIIVAGDHGEAFGQHTGNYGHNLALYEENVRVPLLFHLPALRADARRVSSIASLIDVAPTTLELLGLARPNSFQGVSLLEGRAHMALFFTDYSFGLLGLRDGCLKLIHQLEAQRTRAFDLCRDAPERKDVSALLTDRIPVYRRMLLGWSAAQVAQVERGKSTADARDIR
jgi:arylsulfatase A-like enzyme